MLLVNVVVDVIKWLTGSKKSEVPLVEILVQKIAVFIPNSEPSFSTFDLMLEVKVARRNNLSAYLYIQIYI